jgi:hypothetical protein
MKKIYLLLLPIVFLLAGGCSKDILRSYEKRLTGGTWELYDINNFGLGSRYDSPFTSGRFTFASDGTLHYVDNQGQEYEGSWDIRRDYNGEDTERSLFITVINFQNQETRSEYFNNIFFTGTNRFRAQVFAGGRQYTYKFKR